MSVDLVGRLADGTPVRLQVTNDRISALEPIDDAPADVLVIPGLIDIQINGYAALDLNGDNLDVDTVIRFVRRMWQHGVTAMCPTIITAPEEKILAALRAIVAARAADPLVRHSIVGVHVEGPHLSKADGARGAHDPAYLRDPDRAEFQRWQDAAGGLIRIVTLAAELPGSVEYVAALTESGVVVSIGHTLADPAQIGQAVQAGARLSTHLGNGSPTMMHRHHNHLWPQLAADQLSASFIGDGHHLPAEMLTSMVRAKGIDRAILVSDAATLAGAAPGRYPTPVGGDVIVHPNGKLTVAGTDYLAGSGSALDECLIWTLHHTPFSAAECIQMATANPARLLGLSARGALHIGAPADIVTLNNGRVDSVLVNGTVVRHSQFD